MKIFYTDNKGQKKLLGEADTLEGLVELAVADQATKFIYHRSTDVWKIEKHGPKTTFTKNGWECGYSVET